MQAQKGRRESLYRPPKSSALLLTQKKDSDYVAISGKLSFDAPRSPSLPAAPLLSPGMPRATIWGRRGTVARPREVGWRSGAAGVTKPDENRTSCEDPK